jgi:hypothetical protein
MSPANFGGGTCGMVCRGKIQHTAAAGFTTEFSARSLPWPHCFQHSIPDQGTSLKAAVITAMNITGCSNSALIGADLIGAILRPGESGGTRIIYAANSEE